MLAVFCWTLGAAHTKPHELLETAASQGLLHDMAEMASVSMPDVDHCMPFVSLLRIAHFQGVKAVDKALSSVLTQILVLDAIGRYQEREMKRLNLEVVQKRRSVSSIMELVGGIAHGVAKPGPASMRLVARSLNLIGSQICPAPAGCAGMLLNVSQNSSLGLVPDAKAEELWVSSTPGDLLLSKSRNLSFDSMQGTDATFCARRTSRKAQDIELSAELQAKRRARRRAEGIWAALVNEWSRLLQHCLA